MTQYNKQFSNYKHQITNKSQIPNSNSFAKGDHIEVNELVDLYRSDPTTQTLHISNFAFLYSNTKFEFLIFYVIIKNTKLKIDLYLLKINNAK
jgi:hypothetical protein